jgi:hypothetical protein
LIHRGWVKRGADHVQAREQKAKIAVGDRMILRSEVRSRQQAKKSRRSHRKDSARRDSTTRHSR